MTAFPTTLSPLHLARRFLGTRENRTMLWSIGDQFLVSAANFLVGIVAARLVGVAEFGQFTLILMLAALAGVFVEYITCAPMMTLASRKGRTPSYFGAVALLSVGLGLLAALAVTLTIGGLYMARDGGTSAMLLLAAFVATLGQLMHASVRRILFARRQTLTALLVDIARYGFFAIVVGLSWISDRALSAEWLLTVLGLTAALAAGPSFIALVACRIDTRLLRTVLLRHWPMARWLVLMVVVSIGQEQLVWIAVSLSLGDAAVGGLRAGQYLLGITHFIMLAQENFVPRNAADAYAGGNAAALRTYLIRQTVLLGLPTGGLLLFVALPASFWLTHLFGPEFASYAPVLWIWAAAYAAIFVREMWVYYLRTIEATRGTFHAFALSSAVAVVLIFPAIEAFGVFGAALVVLAAHVVSMAYVLWLVARDGQSRSARADLALAR